MTTLVKRSPTEIRHRAEIERLMVGDTLVPELGNQLPREVVRDWHIEPVEIAAERIEWQVWARLRAGGIAVWRVVSFVPARRRATR